MNVVESGVIAILALAALVAVVVLPVWVAGWVIQLASQSAALLAPVLSDRPCLAGQISHALPADVWPVRRAWRAPPTFLAHLKLRTPGDGLVHS